MTPRRRTALTTAATVLSLVLVAVWWWTAASGDTRTAAPPEASARPSVTASAQDAAVPWGLLRPDRADDQDTAVMVATFLERSVTLAGPDRERWVRAWTRSGRSGPVTAFLDQWVDGLTDGLDVEPDPLNDAPTGVSLQTLGGRVLTAGSDERLTRVILWQRVTVNADRPTSTYLVSFTTVGATDQGPRIEMVDGIRAGPEPDESTDRMYPSLEP